MSPQRNWKRNRSGKEMTEMENRHAAQDSELEEALRNFRLSVHAWSDAAYNRPRAAAAPVRRSVWKMAAGWALGCVLVAGAVTGGVYERHQREVERQQAAAEQARRIQQQAAAHRNEDADTLLAHVDSDLARQVPVAMDPLASLVGDGE